MVLEVLVNAQRNEKDGIRKGREGREGREGKGGKGRERGGKEETEKKE